MREAVIVSAVRTAVGKAPAGTLCHTRPDDMAAAVIGESLRRAEPLRPKDIEDVVMGCAYPEGEQGLNVARIASLRAGLPPSVPGMTINRFCASGLQAIALAAQRILIGEIGVAIAGGTESMSLIPRGGVRYAPNPMLAAEWPGVYTSMGLTAENVAERYRVSRQDADEYAYRSHVLASGAIREGRFRQEILPLEIKSVTIPQGNRIETETRSFDTDEGVRHNPDLAAMGALRPVFKLDGVVTAGNSSQISDGASAVVVMEGKRAKELGLQPMVRFLGFAVAAVPPEIMGMGPVEAVPRVLRQTGLSLSQIDIIELNEAFACQALAVIRELGLDLEITNVNGGAIALGHPLGATGAKLTTQIIHEMKRRESGYGLVTMCIGGGQGAAALFENLQ